LNTLKANMSIHFKSFLIFLALRNGCSIMWSWNAIMIKHCIVWGHYK